MDPLRVVTTPLCAFSARVLVALEEKELPYEVVTVEPGPRPGWVAALTPSGELPLVQLGDRVLLDSTAIVRELDAAFPAVPLCRPPGVAPETIEAGVAFANLELYPAFLRTARPRPGDDEAIWRARLAAALADADAALERSGGPFWCGERFSIVDALLAPLLARLAILEPLRGVRVDPRRVRVTAYSVALAVRPSFARTAPPADALLAHLGRPLEA